MKLSTLTSRAVVIALAKLAFLPNTAQAHENSFSAPAWQLPQHNVGLGIQNHNSPLFQAPQLPLHASAAMQTHNFQTYQQQNLHQDYLSAQNLQLSNTVRIITEATHVAPPGSVSIIEHGAHKFVTAGGPLTEGEKLAIAEIQAYGKQSVRLDAQGNILGGTFVIPANFNGTSSDSLVIPKGAKAIDMATDLSVGSIINNGKLIIEGSKTSQAIDTTSIVNTGLIKGNAALDISASDSISNTGKIISQNGMTLNSASIVNSGLIATGAGDINIKTSQPTDIVINNASGTIQATAGNINVRDAAFAGTNNFTLSGGNLLSQTVNVYSGCGDVEINAGTISGPLNVTAGIMHSYTTTPDLQLGKLTISGDPTFFNVGNIAITGNITTATSGIAIIATGDVTASGNTAILLSTSQAAASSSDIIIMAGAQFTPSSGLTGNSTTSGGDSTTQVTVTGSSVTGGKVDFGSTPVTLDTTPTAPTGNALNGGNVVIVAFAGSSTGSGAIKMAASTIDTSGTPSSAGTPINGNVTLIGGAASGNGIVVGTINTSSTAAANGGAVTILAAVPQIQSPIMITNGVVSNSTNSILLTSFTSANIVLGGDITTSASPVTVATQGTVVLGASITTAGTVTTAAVSPGNIAIFAGASIVDSGIVSTPTLSTSATGTGAGGGDSAGDINLVAGAQLGFAFTPTISLATSAVAQAVDIPIQVSGASSKGGNIAFTVLTQMEAAGDSTATAATQASSGGNVNLIAYAGSGDAKTTGQVSIAASTIATGGQYTSNSFATDGNVAIIAGSTSASAIVIGSINTAGSTVAGGANNASAGGGSITVATAQADANLPIVYEYRQMVSDGTIAQSGTFSPGALSTGSASLGKLSAAGGAYAPGNVPVTTAITVEAGGNLTLNSSVKNAANTLFERVGNDTLVSQASSSIDLFAGGTITFTNGTKISSQPGSIAMAGTGIDGGNITISAKSFAFNNGPTGSSVAIEASGTGGYNVGDQTGGSGGVITLTTTGTGSAATINIGTAVAGGSGYFTVAATNDATSGNAGALNVTSGGNIYVGASSLTLTPQVASNNLPAINAAPNPAQGSGTGPQITLTAANADTGSHMSGNVYIAGDLDADGSASRFLSTTSAGIVGGNGGSINITTNSATIFNVGNATTNGVSGGILKANGDVADGATQYAIGAFGSGGSISITNLGGGIAIGTYTPVTPVGPSAIAGVQVQSSQGNNLYPGGNGGQIILKANGAITSGASLDASGGSASIDRAPGSGGKIEIDSSYMSAFVVGSVTAPTNGVMGTLTANGFGTTQVTAGGAAPASGAISGNGGTIILSNTISGITVVAAGDLTATASAANASLGTFGGDGGTIRLYAPLGAVLVAGSLDVSGGAGSTGPYLTGGNGGTINITASSSSTAFVIGAGATTNGVAGLTANGFSGGTISVTITGTGGLSVGSGVVSAAVTDVSQVPNASVNFGGSGGNISLQATGGPVSINGALDVSGMSGAAMGADGANHAGLGGNLLILSNSTSPFIVNSATANPTNGIGGVLSANGGEGNVSNGNAGTVTVINTGKGGITVMTDGIIVSTPSSGVNGAIQPVPGNGGTINIQSPNGPVVINGALSADGGDTAGKATATNANGLGGTITIVANNGSQVLALTTIATSTMPTAQLSATGWNGGTISVTNNGSGGISVASGAIEVTAETTLVPMDTQGRTGGGPGGTISLQALSGPVTVTGQLSANGADGSVPPAATPPGTAVATAEGGSATLGSPGDSVTINNVTADSAAAPFVAGQTILVTGTVGTATVQEYQTIESVGTNSLMLYQLANQYVAGTINVAAGYLGGNGGQISIVEKVNGSSGFGINSNSQLSATGGASGGNGGTITVTNLGTGGLAITGQSTNMTVAPAAANAFWPGGRGGTLNLNATGAGSKILVTGSLNADGGAAFNGNTNTAGGDGGVIAITVNSTGKSNAFNIGNATVNGVTTGLSAQGQDGGSIGIKNIGTGGIIFSPAAISVAANGSSATSANGGSIDLEATGKAATIATSAAGILSADSGDSSNIAANGGSIIVNATTINTANGALTLSAQGASGAGGYVGVTQTLATASAANALTIGGTGIVVQVAGAYQDGNIAIKSASGINIADTLTTGGMGGGTITLDTLGKGTISGTGTVAADNLILNAGTGGIGSALAPLNTSVLTLAFSAFGSNININNSGAGNMTIVASSDLASALTVKIPASVTIANDFDIVIGGVVSTSGPVALSSSTGYLWVDANVIGRGGISFTGAAVSTDLIPGVNQPAYLVSPTGVTLTTGVIGLLGAYTSTNNLTLAINGDGAFTTAAVINVGNVKVDFSQSTGIATFSLANSLGSVTTTGALNANSISIDTSSASGHDSYSITLGGTVGTTSTGDVTLKAAGDITQTSASNVVSGTNITLSSQTGNIGTLAPVAPGTTTPAGYAPFIISQGTTGGSLAVNVISANGVSQLSRPISGQVNILNTGTGTVSLTGVLTAGDFQLTSAGNINVAAGGNVQSLYGGVTLHNQSTTAGAIDIAGNITGSAGPVIVQNDNTTASGTITVENNVAINGTGRVWDYPGATLGLQYTTDVALISGVFATQPTQGSVPGNVNVSINGQSTNSLPTSGSTAYFGTGLTAGSASVNITSSGNYYLSTVVINGASSSTVILGNNVSLNANGTVQALSSLDLSKTSVVTALQNLATVSNSGISYTNNVLSIANTVSLANLSALDITKSSMVIVNNFGTGDPIAVNLVGTAKAVIAGTLTTSTMSSLDQLNLFVASVANKNDSILDITGSLTSDGGLGINVGGKTSISGTVTAASTGTITIATGAANLGTSKVAPGTVSLSGTIAAGTTNYSGTIVIDSTGSILQKGGSLTADNIAIQFGGNNFSQSTSSQLSLISLSGNLAIQAASTTPTLANNAAILIKNASAANLESLSFDVLNSAMYVAPTQTLAIAGSSAASVNVVGKQNITAGTISADSLTISTTGALNDTGGTIAVGPGHSLNLSAGSINFSGANITLPTGVLLIQATGAINLSNTTIAAGTTNPNYFSGVLSPQDVVAPGALSLISTTGAITVDSGTQLQTVGGNLTLVTPKSSMSLSGQFTALGGNVSALAGTNISGTSPTFTSAASGTTSTNATGGNIEVGSGLTSSAGIIVANLLAPGTVLATPSNQQPDGTSAPLGGQTFINNLVGFATPSGVIAQNLSTTGSINLSINAGAIGAAALTPPSPGQSPGVLNLNGGAMVFDALGTSSLNFNGSNFNTTSFTLISYEAERPFVGAALDLELDPDLENNKIAAPVAQFFCKAGSTILTNKGFELLTTANCTAKYETPKQSGKTKPIIMQWRSGTQMLSALQDMTIITPYAVVEAKKGASFILGVDDDAVRLTACNMPKQLSIRPLRGGEAIALRIGQDVRIGKDAATLAQNLAADGVARRGHKVRSFGDELSMVSCEVSMIGLLSFNDVMKPIRQQPTQAHKQLAKKLLKMTAIYESVTQTHGTYILPTQSSIMSSGLPSRPGLDKTDREHVASLKL